jgi:UDP-N-acetylmuramate dehydrogenase
MNLRKNVSLKSYNTFGLDIYAKRFIAINSDKDVFSFLELIRKTEKPFLFLGGGSNILFSKNFDGIIGKINTKGIRIVEEDDNHVIIKIKAGEEWDNLVEFCANNNFTGIENMSMIPGTCGAAPIQNIGAYGTELKDVLIELEAIELENRKTKTFLNSDCEFGYRSSIFKNKLKGKFLITSITLKLSKKPDFAKLYDPVKEELKKMGVKKLSADQIRKVVCNIRRRKLPDPLELGNAGSFFKNPVISNSQFQEIKKQYPEIRSFSQDNNMVKLSAAQLIELCGWKAKKIGNVGTHKNQALVIVNYGGASGEEIISFANMIRLSVFEKFGIELENEVNQV